jgi:hypothetical protein
MGRPQLPQQLRGSFRQLNAIGARLAHTPPCPLTSNAVLSSTICSLPVEFLFVSELK